MKRGFTLLELMVVVGIIGILSAILLRAVSGSSDSARAATCLANMHNLATACQAVAMETGHYPLAGSVETGTLSVQKNKSGTTSETPGWISWASMGAYRSSPKSHQASLSWFGSTYETTLEKRTYALTNGAIWKAISGNASSYRCPLHVQTAKKHGVQPNWSYVMNGDFVWDTSKGAKTTYATSLGKYFKYLTKLDRRLLFAELPFNADNDQQKVDHSTAPGIALDPTLQYDEDEVIGFNHKSKRKWYAHLCFADGHTEKLEMPGNASTSKLRELTEWLCNGKDVTYDGTNYRELTK